VPIVTGLHHLSASEGVVGYVLQKRRHTGDDVRELGKNGRKQKGAGDCDEPEIFGEK